MSFLVVPVIIVITAGSVILISKIGGKAASQNIRRMKDFSMTEDTDRQEE